MADQEDLGALSVKELKARLTGLGASLDDCFEKSDLVAKLRKTLAAQPAQSGGGGAGGGGAAAAPAPPASLDSPTTTRATYGAFECTVVSNCPPGVAPELVLVLQHGYGASADQFDFLPAFLWGRPEHRAAPLAFVFPQAPIDAASGGMAAWWPINVMEWQQTFFGGGDAGIAKFLRTEHPGMAAARGRAHALVRAVAAAPALGAVGLGRVVLGGFSQGAMVALDGGLSLPAGEGTLGGIVAVSGLPLTVDTWSGWARGHGAALHVWQSHGRSDMLLPFAAAGWLRDLLTQAGVSLGFEAHGGGHDMGPPQMLVKLSAFLKGRRESIMAAATAEGGGGGGGGTAGGVGGAE